MMLAGINIIRGDTPQSLVVTLVIVVLEKLIVGGVDGCCATRVDFAAQLMGPEMPHRELKWEIRS